jgi:HK97 family phage portal protein
MARGPVGVGFFSRIAQKAMARLASGLAGYFTPRWSIPPKRNGRDWLDAAHTSPRLDPIDIIAQDVASAEFDVIRRPVTRRPQADDQILYDSPIYELLDNPMPDHPEIDGWMFRYLSDAYLSIMGECFWVIERGSMGIPSALYIVPPTWVISTPSTQAEYYRVLPLGNISVAQINIAPEDMVWAKSPDFVNPYWRGRGRTEAIGDEVESDEYAAKFSKRFFYNDATPSILISAPGITEPDAKRFKESWQQNLGGMFNFKKPAIVPSEIKVEKLSDSPREMDFNESRRFLADQCRYHFSIPPEIMGNVENSNRSTIDSAFYLYSKNVVTRHLCRWEKIINRQLCPKFPGNQVIKFKSIVPEDEAFKLQRANEGLSRGALKINEWRKECGYDEAPDGDGWLRPLGLQFIPAGKASERVLEIAAPEPEEDEEPEESGEMAKAMRYAIAKSVVKGLTDDAKRAYHAGVAAQAAEDERLFLEALKSLGLEQHSAISAEFRAARKLGQSYTLAMETACERVFGKSADEVVAAKLGPAWMQTMHDGAVKAANLLGLPPNFDLYNVYFDKWVNEVGAQQISGAINQTTKDALQATIADAVEAGESSAKIAARIKDEFEKLTGDEMTASRAMNIARTETQRSINYGQLITYKSEGVGRKEWLANSFGEDARESHQALNGVIINIDDDFEDTDTGAIGPAPGMFNDPASDINCRCTLLPVVEG